MLVMRPFCTVWPQAEATCEEWDAGCDEWQQDGMNGGFAVSALRLR
jgi:hypothetical protein